MVLKVLIKFGRSYESADKFVSAVVSRKPKTALSTITRVKNFDHTGRGLCHEIFV